MKAIIRSINVLLIAIFGWIAGVFILSGGKLESFSEADLTPLAWMLFFLLIGISRLNWKMGDHHPNRNDVLLKNWHDIKIDWYRGWIPKPRIIKRSYTIGDAFEITGWLFASVAAFGLGGSKFMVAAHYVATPLAAIAAFILVVRLTSDKKDRTLYIVALLASAVVWLLGLFDVIFTVFFGELLYTIVVAHKYKQELKKFEG